MVIRDFNVVRMSSLPAEANSILIVDPDAVIPFAIATESFEAIPGGIASSARSPTRLICVSFLRATGHNFDGHVARAAFVAAPSNTSSVPRSANENITAHIITLNG